MALLDWAAPVSGFVAGTAGVLVSHPFDTVKTRLQAGWHGPRSSVLQITLQEQGVGGLYRGIWPPLLHAGLIQSVTFWLYQTSRDALHGRAPAPAFLAGVISGAIPGVFLLPGWFVKVQLQNEKGRKRTGTIAFCAALVRRHGLLPVFRAIYGRAFAVSLLADSLGRAFYFGTYDAMKRWLVRPDAPLSLAERLLAASCSGIAGWTSMYALDTLRSCILTGPVVGNPVGAAATARGLYAEGGLRAFYRGFSVTLLRAVPVAAFVLTSYDLVYEALKRWQLQQRARVYNPDIPNPSVRQPPGGLGPSFE